MWLAFGNIRVPSPVSVDELLAQETTPAGPRTTGLQVAWPDVLAYHVYILMSIGIAISGWANAGFAVGLSALGTSGPALSAGGGLKRVCGGVTKLKNRGVDYCSPCDGGSVLGLTWIFRTTVWVHYHVLGAVSVSLFASCLQIRSSQVDEFFKFSQQLLHDKGGALPAQPTTHATLWTCSPLAGHSYGNAPYV